MHAYLLNAIFFVTTVKLEASKPCLTWSVQNNAITILFRTNIVSLPVLFYDPLGQEQAKCGSNNNSIACETSHPFGRIEYKRTAIIFTIAKITEHFKYGNWSCRYGQNTIHVLVSLLEGIVDETNLELTGSLTEDDNIITLNCFTCWNVLADSVEFLYNDESVVNLRYINGQCFYTKGECEPRYCACSRHNYEWKTKLQNTINIKFSCKARFRDEFMKMEFFKYTTVVFNGTAFEADGTITEINEPFINDDKWKTKDNDTDVIGTVHDAKWYVIVPSVLVLIGLTILVIKMCKRKEKSSEKNIITKSAVEEHNLLLEPQKDVSSSSDDRHHQDCKDVSTSTEGIKESSTVFSATCHACKNYGTGAMCIDCEQILCEKCCCLHTNCYKEHCMFQVNLINMSSSKIQCKACCKVEGTEVCLQCIKVFCDACAYQHVHPKIKIAPFNPKSKHSYTNTMSEHEDNYIKFKAKITVHAGSGSSEPPVRVCGIAFLSDDIIVLTDNFNKKLQVFKEYKFLFEEDLIDEPRGLTPMTEKKIAITFPYRNQIKIFEVKAKRLVTTNIMNMNVFGLGKVKPFAISYDNNCFAVEVDEDEYGKIIIVDDRRMRHIISNTYHFAHFTGKTINLALDTENKRVFVSAISRNTVSCVNFDGNVLWTYQLSGLRGLVLIPSLGKTKLLLTSKRDDTICQLNADDGREDVLMLKGKIKSPCCLAYNKSKRLLCIQVTTENGKEDLLVYQYSYNATTPLYERTQFK